jgi:hypothetical protein
MPKSHWQLKETIQSFKLCIEGAEIARKLSRHENASKAKSFARLMGCV